MQVRNAFYLKMERKLESANIWTRIIPHPHICQTSRLGVVVVSVLATVPKGCVFKTRPRRWIFKGDKNPQLTFLSDGK
jgi:hypothetical protein